MKDVDNKKHNKATKNLEWCTLCTLPISPNWDIQNDQTYTQINQPEVSIHKTQLGLTKKETPLSQQGMWPSLDGNYLN